jgi:hypothetical protein
VLPVAVTGSKLPLPTTMEEGEWTVGREREERIPVGRHVTGRTGVEVPVPLRWLGERQSQNLQQEPADPNQGVEKVEAPGQEQGGNAPVTSPLGRWTSNVGLM